MPPITEGTETDPDPRWRKPGRAGRLAIATLLVVLSCLGPRSLLAADGSSAAPYPGSVSQWRARRNANAAYSQGQLTEAARIYKGLLASMSPIDARRGEALYRMALIHLTAKPPLGNSSLARGELRELVKTFPRDENRIAADAILATLAQSAAQHAKTAALSQKLRELEARVTKLKKVNAQELESRAAGAQQTERQLRGEIEKLKKKISTLESKLKKEQAALAKARAALRKVSETLVGGKKSGD